LLDELAAKLGGWVYPHWFRLQMKKGIAPGDVRYPKAAIRDVPTLIEQLSCGDEVAARDAIAALCPADGRHAPKKVWRAIPETRLTHLLGMCGATLVRSVTFSIAILAAVALFVPVDLSKANALSAVVLLAVGALAFIGLGIASASFPLMWTEKGLQMAYIVQAVVLLVSGVYYPVDVLPSWMQALSTISPATYVIRGMRAALLDGADLTTLWPEVWPALVVGVVSVPLGLRLFVEVERYAKRTGRLKRSG